MRRVVLRETGRVVTCVDDDLARRWVTEGRADWLAPEDAVSAVETGAQTTQPRGARLTGVETR